MELFIVLYFVICLPHKLIHCLAGPSEHLPTLHQCKTNKKCFTKRAINDDCGIPVTIYELHYTIYQIVRFKNGGQNSTRGPNNIIEYGPRFHFLWGPIFYLTPALHPWRNVNIMCQCCYITGNLF